MRFNNLSSPLYQQLNKSFYTRSLQTWTCGSESYNYLEKSQIPTDLYKAKLPTLPIPSLADSCRRYLTALKPIIRDECQYQKTANIVESFSIGIGQQLHNKLLELNKHLKHTSYIADDWSDSYLSSRIPLPLNYNPFLILEDDPDPRFNDPCIKVANYLISCLRYRRSLLDNVLAPVVDPPKKNKDAVPYDMSQFSSLFETTRIPFVDIDCLQDFQNSKHVVVMKNGLFYSFNVIDHDNNLVSPNEIASCIAHIWNLPHSESDHHGISWLTTLPRDEWARLRAHLIEEPDNSNSLSIIDSAITVICLDSNINHEGVRDASTMSSLAHNFLHGCPTTNSDKAYLNRWFDKSFSTIFTGDGTTAINFEHSWADGVTLSRFYERVFGDFTRNRFVSPDDIKPVDIQNKVHCVEFTFDDHIKLHVEDAKKRHLCATNNLDLNYVAPDDITKSFLKSKRVSPDSFFQLAFQMAFFEISQGSTAATYESCSTAAFKHGRTETIRSATLSTQKACQMLLLDRENYSFAQLRAAINECSQVHSRLAKEASTGFGFDRHFFALKHAAARQGMEDVSLFGDLSWTEANHFTLSTSSLYSGKITGGGFGPVVDDGYGLAYGYNEDNLTVMASNYKSRRHGSQFADALKMSMNEIIKVLRET